MKWKKQGRIIQMEQFKSVPWMESHLQLPVPLKLKNGNYRVYFSSRFKGKSLPTFVDLDKDTLKIIYRNEEPLLSIGNPGFFDDSGVMFSSVVEYDDKIYMYYIGWNLSVSVSYHNSIGLAISEDGGLSFKRYSEGPILDRSLTDPIFVSSPYVLKQKGNWILYYLSCKAWIQGEKKLEPVYDIRYAESADGICWLVPKNNVCITGTEEAISQPYVIRESNIFRMWYSTRGILDYRKNKDNSYRIGYAESLDGIKWIRKDDEAGITVSDDGWDSEMIAYAGVLKEKDRYIMFYNGNGFGESGIGYATTEESMTDRHIAAKE